MKKYSTTPKNLAVALAYDAAKMTAPVVVGVGERLSAKSLQRAARRWGIPIAENEELAHSLALLPEQSAILESQYEAVAELINEVSAPHAGVLKR